MTTRIHASAIVAVFAVSAISVSAHHTISTIYDVTQRVTLKGTIAEIEWKQPHVMIHLDVTTNEGPVVRWDVETQAPNVLRRHGILQGFATPGETVGVTVCLAKDGGAKGWLSAIMLPTGITNLSAGGC